MPRFAALADMQARFEERDLLQLTDESGAGVIDAARIDRALDRADAEIVSKVAVRYADVATFEGHPLLTDIACVLAFADLWRSDLPEWVKDPRKDARKDLDQIAAGTKKLDEGVETAAPRPDNIVVSTPPRVFSRGDLDAF